MRLSQMPTIVAFFFAFLTLALLLASSMNLNLSTVMAQIGISPAIVGTAMSMFPIGACVAAAVFAPVYGKLKTQTMTVGIVCAIVGHAINFTAAGQPEVSVWAFYVGIFIVGCGVNFVGLSVPMTLSILVDHRIVTAALGFSYVFQNLGSFLGSPFSQVVMAIAPAGSPLRYVWVGSIALGFVLLVIAFVSGLWTTKMVTKKVKENRADEMSAEKKEVVE